MLYQHDHKGHEFSNVTKVEIYPGQSYDHTYAMPIDKKVQQNVWYKTYFLFGKSDSLFGRIEWDKSYGFSVAYENM